MEMPLMLMVIVVAARRIVRHLTVPSTLSNRLGIGCVALGLLLLTEFTLVLWVQGLLLSEHFASRDPVAGTVYYVMLGLLPSCRFLWIEDKTAYSPWLSVIFRYLLLNAGICKS